MSTLEIPSSVMARPRPFRIDSAGLAGVEGTLKSMMREPVIMTKSVNVPPVSMPIRTRRSLSALCMSFFIFEAQWDRIKPYQTRLRLQMRRARIVVCTSLFIVLAVSRPVQNVQGQESQEQDEPVRLKTDLVTTNVIVTDEKGHVI